jgi:hypothetical protein
MHRILRTLLVFILLAAGGFAAAQTLPDKTPLSSWELVDNQNPKLIDTTPRGRITERMRVPGGWIYQTTIATKSPAGSVAIAMAFVPDSAADSPATASKLADDKEAGKK